MLSENKLEDKFDILIRQINELKDRIIKLENIILVNGCSINDYSDYNISNDVIMEPIIDRSICFTEPPLTRQNAFIRS